MTTPDDRHKPKRTLARSLGMFVGHIVKAAKADPSDHDPETLDRRTTTHEETRETETGERVTLRRTVIEEIELSRDDTPFSPPTPDTTQRPKDDAR